MGHSGPQAKSNKNLNLLKNGQNNMQNMLNGAWRIAVVGNYNRIIIYSLSAQKKTDYIFFIILFILHIIRRETPYVTFSF